MARYAWRCGCYSRVVLRAACGNGWIMISRVLSFSRRRSRYGRGVLVLTIDSSSDGLQSALEIVSIGLRRRLVGLTRVGGASRMLAVGKACSEFFVLVRIHLTCLLPIKVLLCLAGQIVTRTRSLLLLCSGLALLHNFLVSLISLVYSWPHSVQQLQLILDGIVRFLPGGSEVLIAHARMLCKVRED